MERVLNGRYRVGPRIGDGGMAVVYRGFDMLLGRSVAIKVLREQYAADPQFVARFEREAQAVATLNHPNIINIFDVGVDEGGGHYFVMEFIDGPNLKEVIRARGPLPIDETVAITIQVLSGLGYAHDRGLVHRDVKPQNIMLLRDGVAKVTDFGIAKGLTDATLTEAGIGMGTVHYISPEQAHGNPATPASDLYAAGVMLYEMLTGALPFTGDSAVGVAVKHVHDPPPPPVRLNAALPAQLSALTLHALEKDPAARFGSAREMATALRNWRAWPMGSGGGARRPPPRGVAPNGRGGGAVPIGRGTGVIPAARRPARPVRRDGLGCATWLVGAGVLAALLGLLVAGYRLSPLGEAAARSSPTAPRVASSPGLPAAPAVAPTPIATIAAATAAVPVARPGTATATRARATGTAGTPVALLVPSPTVAPTPEPTATPEPTPTEAPVPTATPTRAPTPRPPTPTPTPVPLVTVPNLAGRTLAGAQGAAGAVGLAVEQGGAGNSATVPAGQILTQDPAPGVRVERGTTIFVIVSRGPLLVTVPDVVDQGYETAAGRLGEAGLRVARVDQPSRDVPRNVVISQDPVGGAAVAPGTLVTLGVSSGAPAPPPTPTANNLVQVPNVVGLSVEEARGRLAAAGLTLVSVNGQTRAQLQRENPAFLQNNPSLRSGQVISQSLAPGTSVQRGASINIAFFQGP